MRPWIVTIWLALPACASSPEPARLPNVLLVSLDTLRADHVGGSDRSLMPNLARFARESIVFEQAYAQSNETPFSHASILTGRYPTELGHLDYGFRLPADVPTMPSVLRAYGYRTGAFVGGAFLSAAFGFDAGFDTFAAPLDWGALWHTAPLALAWIQSQSAQPWFAFVHAYDMHSPYLKPSPIGTMYLDPAYSGPGQAALEEPSGTDRVVDGGYYSGPRGAPILDMWTNRVRVSEGGVTRHQLASGVARVGAIEPADIAAIRAAYAGAATNLDAQFGLFLADLAAAGALDDTLVVVLADHGEELGERGVFNHRWGLSQEVLHVPLLVRLPGGRGGGQRVTTVVELTRVLPTVLSLVGATTPAGLPGGPLVDREGIPSTVGGVAFAEGTCRAVAVRQAGELSVFAGLSADSPWLSQAIEEAPGREPWFSGGDVQAVRGWLTAWRSTLTAPPASRAPTALDATLREHGYWEAQ